MAKRFTDSTKWQDNWFTDLTNDQKIIWIYLLDHCDNAGIWKINMKNLNYFCSTNISVEEFILIFNKRLTRINDELSLINKFCYFQYGSDFLTSKNKAVVSAINKLISVGIVKKINGNYTPTIDFSMGIDTLSIPYQYPIDTPKEEEEEKEEVKEQVKVEVKEQVKVNNKVENNDKDSKLKRLVTACKSLIDDGLENKETLSKMTMKDVEPFLDKLFIGYKNWKEDINKRDTQTFITQLPDNIKEKINDHYYAYIQAYRIL
jgi:hypothetical protein